MERECVKSTKKLMPVAAIVHIELTGTINICFAIAFPRIYEFVIGIKT